jgi:hypothetical protein
LGRNIANPERIRVMKTWLIPPVAVPMAMVLIVIAIGLWRLQW